MGSNKVKMVSAKEFYNEIANEYDARLSLDKDQAIRNDIAKYFKEKIAIGQVLDFGGGTGLDLKWLTEAGYSVCFCEPAEKMRAIAKNMTKDWATENKPQFLNDGDHNYKSWSVDQHPFERPINAIVANFGVVNYIDDLDKMFDVFTNITGKESHILINLLKVPVKIIYTKLIKNATKAFVKREPIRAGSSYKNIGHETILYKVKDIEKAAHPQFKLVHSQVLGDNTDFTLLHFTKA